jgi:hypothetical protein
MLSGAERVMPASAGLAAASTVVALPLAFYLEADWCQFGCRPNTSTVFLARAGRRCQPTSVPGSKRAPASRTAATASRARLRARRTEFLEPCGRDVDLRRKGPLVDAGRWLVAVSDDDHRHPQRLFVHASRMADDPVLTDHFAMVRGQGDERPSEVTFVEVDCRLGRVRPTGVPVENAVVQGRMRCAENRA